MQNQGMRTETDVYNRVKWDQDLDEKEFYIGFLSLDPVEMVEIVEEVRFASFNREVVPMHRIRYFKFHDIEVWNREEKIDNFFGSMTRTQRKQKVTRRTIHDIIAEYHSL